MGLLTVWGALGILSMCEEPEAPMSIPNGDYSYAQYAPCWAWDWQNYQWVSGQEYSQTSSYYDGYSYGYGGGSAFVDFGWNDEGDTHFKVQVGLACEDYYGCYCYQEVTRNFKIEINQDTQNDPAFEYLEQNVYIYTELNYYQGWRGCSSLEPSGGGIIRNWFNKGGDEPDYGYYDDYYYDDYYCYGYYSDYTCLDGYDQEYCYTYYDDDNVEQESCYTYYYCTEYEYSGDYNYYCYQYGGYYGYYGSYGSMAPIRLGQMQYMYSDTCDKEDPCSKIISVQVYPYYDDEDNKIWLENSDYFIFDFHTNQAMATFCSFLLPAVASIIWQ